MADECESKDIEEESSNKADLTAKQKKNKKKKEAAKKKKQEQKKNASDFQGDDSTQEPMSLQEQVEEELSWCISQMEIGLKVQKPDKTTVSQTEHLIKSLKSPKVPLPKKRQIMRSVFGDYRKKMQDDLKKNQSKEEEKTVKVFPVKKSQQRSIFLRVAQDKKHAMTDKPSDEAECNGNTQTSETHIAKPAWKFEPSSGDFKFNFESQTM